MQDGAIKISEQEFHQLADFVKSNYGIHLGVEKKTLVVGRLSSVLAQENFRNFTDYFKYLISDNTGRALVTLMDKITTNHTFFMREANHFQYFHDNVLPELSKSVSDRDLRIWSAGCSTGEEPYTLAMLLNEFFDREKHLWNAKILATDISTKSLEFAKQAEYTDEQIVGLPSRWKLNHFSKIAAGKYKLSKQIRDEVIFRRFNFMEPNFPFKKKFHIIFCRNVMIYFDTQTKKELVEKFYQCMEPGGYLFIGHSETLNNINKRFRYVLPAIYRKESWS